MSVLVARISAAGKIGLDREPRQVPGEGEVGLKVSAVGLCGSDRHWFEEGSIGDAAISSPLVLGHEFCGVVLDGPRAGERVIADPAIPCGSCSLCLSGRTNICPTIAFAGYAGTDGALRTEMAWPARLLHTVPAHIPDTQATLLEPLGIAVHAHEIASASGPITSAGVYGCGPLGLLLVGLLRAAGVSQIVATDVVLERLAAARGMGATDTFAVDRPAQRRAAREISVDAAFETAGEDDALDDALTAVRPGGPVVLIGIPAGDRTSFVASTARRKGLTLALCRRMLPEHLDRAIELAADGRIPLEAMVTHVYPLTEVADAFATLMARRGLKVVVTPN